MSKEEIQAEHCDVMVQQKGCHEHTPTQCFKHEIPILEEIHGKGSVKRYDRVENKQDFVTDHKKKGGMKKEPKIAKYEKVTLNIVKEAARLDAKYGSGKGAIFLNILSAVEGKKAKKGDAASAAVTTDPPPA